MRIIPKFASGGYSLYFTRASASLLPALNVTTALPAKASSSSSGSDNNLSEKDFFNMVKDIDGLPNEMRDIIGLLSNIFAYLNITGDSLTDLSSIYLNTLYQVKVAAQNKKRYDKTLENALTNGSMYEPAITAAGGLLVLDENGSLVLIDPRQYLENPNEYIPVTVSLLMNMRAYDPGMAYDKYAFDIANNSVGFEEFTKLLKEAISKLGTTTNSTDLRTPVDPEATIEEIQLLGAEGISYYLLKSTLIHLDSKDQIERLIKYLVRSMPRRLMTWAMIKDNNTDGPLALANLIFDYLKAGESIVDKTTLYIDPKTAKNGAGASSGGSGTSPRAGWWYSFVTGLNGAPSPFLLLGGGPGGMISEAQYVGLIDKMHGMYSLRDFISESHIGDVMNTLTIAFGDQIINIDSYKDIAVDTGAGIYRVLLPMDINGTPNFKAADEYAEIMAIINTIKHNGDEPDIERLLNDYPNIALYFDRTTGGWDFKNKFRYYAVVRGVATDNAKVDVMQQGSPKPVLTDIKDIHSPWIDDVDETDSDYNDIKKALDNKHLGNGSLWGWLGHTDLYRGMIYILINNNLVNASNADNYNRSRSNITTDYLAYLGDERDINDYTDDLGKDPYLQ